MKQVGYVVGFLLIAALLLILPIALFAQDGAPVVGFDWGSVGVDIALVGVVIAVAQYIKRNFFANAKPLYSFLIVVGLSIVVGVFANLGKGLDTLAIIKAGFFYATASVAMYEGIKSAARTLKS